MRILYFTRDYTTHDYRFLKAIAEIGHTLYYLRLENSGGNYESRPLPEGVIPIDWAFGKTHMSPDRENEAVLSLRTIAEQIQPDILHSGPIPDISYMTARAGLHPHVVMSWGFDLQLDIQHSEYSRFCASFAIANCDWFLGDCAAVCTEAQQFGLPKCRSTLFPWGVDPHFFQNRPSPLRRNLARSDEFLILCLRSMESNYRVDTVIKAFLVAAEKEPRLKLALLGDGSLRSELQSLAAHSPFADRILWLGRQPNHQLAHYYNAADLYVSASIVDGSSVSLLEAMACETPVLVSDIAGNLEWVTDQQNGYIFPTCDDQILAQKILEIANSPQRNQRIATAARALICEKADWEQNKYLLNEAYQGALSVWKEKQAYLC